MGLLTNLGKLTFGFYFLFLVNDWLCLSSRASPLSKESLYLFDNIFGGFLPTEFANMAALKSLRLNNNLLSGGLPDFSGLRNLETFFANNNSKYCGLKCGDAPFEDASW